LSQARFTGKYKYKATSGVNTTGKRHQLHKLLCRGAGERERESERERSLLTINK
jgi:hypothetical protein